MRHPSLSQKLGSWSSHLHARPTTTPFTQARGAIYTALSVSGTTMVATSVSAMSTAWVHALLLATPSLHVFWQYGRLVLREPATSKEPSIMRTRTSNSGVLYVTRYLESIMAYPPQQSQQPLLRLLLGAQYLWLAASLRRATLTLP